MLMCGTSDTELNDRQSVRERGVAAPSEAALAVERVGGPVDRPGPGPATVPDELFVIASRRKPRVGREGGGRAAMNAIATP